MDRKLGQKKQNPMMNLAMKKMMAKNMMGRKKGKMISRQEFQSPPKQEREEERDMVEPERHSSKSGIEKMRKNNGNYS